tara:strand:+ start:6091 stop:6279 length:189 start_codon:yes stop_codon:yes gene_type:complete
MAQAFSPEEVRRSDKGVGFLRTDIDLTNLTISDRFVWVKPDSPKYDSALKLAEAIEKAQKKT